MHNPMFSLAGDAVVNVYINHEKKFAFVEMRTVEEASNAMTLDGIIFEANDSKLFSFILVTVLVKEQYVIFCIII
jgi:splicing factor U2AF subunit